MWRELCRGCLVWFRCRVDRYYRSCESFSFWNLDGVSCLVGSCSSCPWLWIVVFDVHHDETLRALRVHFSTRYGVSFEMIFLPFCKIGGLVLGRIKTKSNGTTLTFQELSSFTQIYVIEYLKKITEFCNSPHFCTLKLLEIRSKKFKISLLESCNRAFRTRNS